MARSQVAASLAQTPFQVHQTAHIPAYDQLGICCQERIQPFKDKAALHERNIEAIQKEIARLQ